MAGLSHIVSLPKVVPKDIMVGPVCVQQDNDEHSDASD